MAAWERLALRAYKTNPFFEPWYLLPSLRQFGAGGDVQVMAWFRQGRLAGILPMLRSAAYYGRLVPHARGWLHSNAFCGVPYIAAGHEENFWRDLLAHLDRPARSKPCSCTCPCCRRMAGPMPR